MRQSFKNNRHQSDRSDFKISGTDQLSQKLLNTPIKNSNQITKIFELRSQQNKFLQQMSPNQTESLKKQSTNPQTATQKQILRSQSSKGNTLTYVLGCVTRSFGFRKLSVEDIGQIFGIEGEVVEQIDKYRILTEYEEDVKKSTKLEVMKGNILDRLRENLRNFMSEGVKKNISNLRRSFPRRDKSNQSRSAPKMPLATLEDQHIGSSHPSLALTRGQTQQGMPQLQAQRIQQQAFDDYEQLTDNLGELTYTEPKKVLEYERLLRNKPPHRLDYKLAAVAAILKSRPELTQQDILEVLADEYNIRDMNQGAISRSIKKIYEMKKHVDVILQAQREGYVLL